MDRSMGCVSSESNAESVIRLSRCDLARVLESKLRSEIVSARRMKGSAASQLPSDWGDDLSLTADLGSDSLERLWLAASVNEMFHLEEFGKAETLPSCDRFGDWVDVLSACEAEGLRRITFSTSGSTGRPKPCRHEAGDILAEIDVLADLFPGRRRVVTTVPPHHIYGFLFGVLLPKRLGVPVCNIEAAGGLRSGDLVISFPDRWRFLERSLSSVPADVLGVTSTAPCPRDLIASLIERGLAGMTEVYGSSETGGIGTRAWPAAEYTLMPHWQRVSETMDDVRLARGGRAVTPMDDLHWSQANLFTVAGRGDHAVQVGGVNVFPGRVAETLRRHPGVQDAAVRLQQGGDLSRLKAFVVPRPGSGELESLEAELRLWVRETLAAPERPQTFAFGRSLPRSPEGKLIDWAD